MPDPAILVLLFVVGAWFSLGAGCAAHAIMYKRDPRSTGLWILICLTLPFIGSWLYWEFGINRIYRRALRRRGRYEGRDGSPLAGPASVGDKSSAIDVGHLGALKTIADHVSRLPLVAGNRITPLHNGEQAYPAMLEAIERARSSVCLASYIFDWDDVGGQFAAALGAAAARGARVHVLLDGLGAVQSFSRMGRMMIKSGAAVAAFFPLRFPLGRLRINLRNHRKILVTDGQVGFTGGMNVSARHLAGRPDLGRVEDIHFRLAGPIVSHLQEVFVEDWSFATGEFLGGPAYFPKLSARGEAACRGIISGPDQDFERIHWIVQAACAAAQHSIHIVTPYFVPTTPVISALVVAALRGVRITLILPSTLDLPYMRWAADAYLWQLLEHGVRVYRRPSPFVHSKLILVDRRWLLLGSANLDRRSFRLNFEFNVEVYDPALPSELTDWLERITDVIPAVTLDELDSRPKLRRFRDGLAKLMSPYL